MKQHIWIALLCCFTFTVTAAQAGPPGDIFADPAGPRPQRGPVVHQPAATVAAPAQPTSVWCAKLGKNIPRGEYTKKKCKKPGAPADEDSVEISAEDLKKVLDRLTAVEKQLEKVEEEKPEEVNSGNIWGQAPIVFLFLLSIGGLVVGGSALHIARGGKFAIAGLNVRFRRALVAPPPS